MRSCLPEQQPKPPAQQQQLFPQALRAHLLLPLLLLLLPLWAKPLVLLLLQL